MTGCGVALFDYDHDGWPDLFFVNSSTFRPDEATAHPGNCLFRNNRDGTFTDVTADSGLARPGWGQGCCIGDYDNDGLDDLFVTYWGQNVLYRNMGKGRFRDVTRDAGLITGERRWNTGCCFLDYDKDGFLDLFVANYIQFDPALDPGIGGSAYCQLNGQPVACGPRGFPGGTNLALSKPGRWNLRRRDGTRRNRSTERTAFPEFRAGELDTARLVWFCGHRRRFRQR